MTRVMFDGTHELVPNIPLDAQMVAGYLAPSPFAWTAADWARFPGAAKVRIAVRSTTNDGHVLDVESGDATPAQAPGWVVMRRAAGADPTVYCSEGLWPSVRAAFTAANVAQPHYWVAAYPGGGAIIPAGAVAHQYMDAGIYDKSVVADFWPGVDQGGNVTDPQAIAADVLNEKISGPDGPTPYSLNDMEYWNNQYANQIPGLGKAVNALAQQLTAVQAAVATLTTAVAALQVPTELAGQATVTITLAPPTGGTP